MVRCPLVQFSRTFAKQRKKLPKNLQDAFYEKLKLLIEDFSHPSLRITKMSGFDIWELSITMNYRATFEIVEENTVYFRKIGGHDILKKP